MKLLVKNWRQFQHYKDRNPPWIKLHFALLSSKDWVTLNDASRVLAIACMLVASKNDGEIDGSDAGLAYLQRVAYLNGKPNLKPLIECGFLESASTDASKPLADARPETENLKQTETEKKAAPLALPDWLPKDAWQGWLEVRGKKKAANTERALKLAIGKLERFKSEGHDPEQILNNSIVGSWTDLYQPKQEKSTVAGSAPRPTIQCRSCGNRVSTWTGHQCDPCWRKSQGMDNPLAGLQ